MKVTIRDDDSGRWLENSLRFSVGEAAAHREGADAMLAKLSEVVFAETLRRYMRTLPPQQTGWMAAARDPEVGKALTLMHHRHGDPWTVAALAQEVGLSRTVLAERFRHFLGVSPMAYLTRWRLQIGARSLTSTSRGVAEIAADVGYESEAAFNRAFKREYSVPPREVPSGAESCTRNPIERCGAHRRSLALRMVQLIGRDATTTSMRSAGTLRALRADVDAGLVGRIAQRAAGEVLGDMLGLAKEAPGDGSDAAKNVAAVLTAAAYEDAIRQMGATPAAVQGRPALAAVINSLKDAGVLVGEALKTGQNYLKFRNDALHADWANVDRVVVGSCMAFVEGLLLKHLS
jgi:AraC-like DNA-binding protein